jgi:hypothetical protein
MQRFSYIFVFLLLLVSCSREDLSSTGQQLEITLSCVSADDTKAGEDDENIYPEEGVDVLLHENLLSTVDLFFYPGNDVTSDAAYHVFKDYGEVGKIKSDILRLSLDSDIINSVIFPSHENVTQCYVFAVVNYPGQLVETDNEGKDILTGTSLAQLEAIKVSTNFITPGTGESSHYHSNFMMSGSSIMSLRGRNQILAGSTTIELQRYACKMTVGVNVAPQVYKDNEVWEPMLESMEIYLVDGVKTVCLSGEMPKDPSDSYFSFRSNSMRFTDLAGNPLFPKDGDYLQTYPFYMYPQRWVYGRTESPDKEPYLKLVLPWKRVMGGYTQKQYYYKIFIPDDYREENICRFVRNNWYHINIDVGILGSETDEDKVTPEISFYVVDWQDKNIVIKNADIGKARYLSVDRDTCIIYNEPQARLSYVSSHPVSIPPESIRVGRIYYGTEAVGRKTLGGTVTVAGENDIFPEGTVFLNYDKTQREALNDGTDWFEDKESAILFKHNLNNNYKDPVFDYSYYVIRFVLVHTDHPESVLYRKEQTIIQYPGIYLDRTPNPDNITEDGNNSVAEHGGYVYINDAQYSEEDYETEGKPKENLWRVVCYNGGGTDMYKISVTVLPRDEDGKGFIIGDPRSKTSVIYSPNIPYVTARYIKPDNTVSEVGEKRNLYKYYPTDESSRTENMIAPSYRISTKLSGTYTNTKISKTQAQYRCAAFQENGFPAGRWRLPTMAEISFSAQLSANEVFTAQFSTHYWSANGVVYVSSDSGTVTPTPGITEAFVRCVYDSWYWGDDRVVEDENGNAKLVKDNSGTPSIFVWGDEYDGTE